MNPQKSVAVSGITFGNNRPFVLIAGPCQLESREHAFGLAQRLADLTDTLNIPFIFKASYDKANRTSINGTRGIGMEKGLEILAAIRDKFGCPVITDVHTEEQCAIVAQSVDILQIPALLSRQTDLLIAAANTGKPIHVKKGQFLAPWDMANVAKKIASTGNDNILLCERGTSFGYNTLVNDMRALPIMAETGYPVVFDATHSVQKPAGQGDSTGGDRTMVPHLSRAAIAVGIAGLFIETHQDPDHAPSDGPNMVRLDDMPKLLQTLKQLDNLIKEGN
ncbi:MAG: 3-deoxy-8-phosphooctulonate synthase [Alphaproteobacteria bacterium]|nr:3-deoxy-8-phosphooctulonate synthase [Alphaproteobacteria bacterium]